MTMKYWIQSHGSGANLAIRADGDPFDDFDVVAEFFHSGKREWIADENLAGEMMQEPNLRLVSEAEVLHLIRQQSAA